MSTTVNNPVMYAKLPYDPVKDFAAVGMIATIPFIVLAHPSVKARTLQCWNGFKERIPEFRRLAGL